MNYEELAQQLLKGQDAIDRKKKEIVRLVSMLVGLVSNRDEHFKMLPKYHTSVPDNDRGWQIIKQGGNLYVQYLVRGRILLDSRNDTCDFNDVPRLHADLPEFVEKMVSVFPNLPSIWKTFVTEGSQTE